MTWERKEFLRYEEYFALARKRKKKRRKLIEELAENALVAVGSETTFLGNGFVQLFFLRREPFRNADAEGNDEIALAAIRKFGGAFAAESDGFSVLGTGFDVDFLFPDDRDGDFLLGSENHFDGIEVEIEAQIGPVALESALGSRDGEMEVEVPVAIRPFVSFAADLDGHSVFDSGGNVDLPVGFEKHVALAAALMAGVFDDFPIPAASRTGYGLLHDPENGLHALPNASGTSAIGTLFRFAPFFGSGTRAIGTHLPTFVRDFLGTSFDGFFEGRFDADFDIVPDFATTSAGTPSTLETAPEELLENIGEIEIGMESARTAETAVRIAAETVVRGFFLSVRQRGVGLIDFFEFGLLRFVALVAVGMKLHGLLPVGLLDFVGGSFAANAEHVVKFVCHSEC